MLRVGVTASIGAGKTTVCKLLKELGCYYCNTDEIAKILLTTNPSIIKEVKELFGEEAYTNDDINTSYISKIVFNDKNKRNSLEKILEPKMRAYVNHMAEVLTDKKILVVESAIFFETNTEDMVDLMIGINAPEAIRIERVQRRNGFTVDEVLARMNAQMNNENKMRRCDFIIDNSGNSDELFASVQNIYNLLNKIANL